MNPHTMGNGCRTGLMSLAPWEATQTLRLLRLCAQSAQMRSPGCSANSKEVEAHWIGGSMSSSRNRDSSSTAFRSTSVCCARCVVFTHSAPLAEPAIPNLLELVESEPGCIPEAL